MSEARGLRSIGYLDCKGGGQVIVDGTIAYVGHTVGPEGTTIIDVSDPTKPRVIAELPIKQTNTHSHKVRVQDGLMIRNSESIVYAGEPPADFVGGLEIYDVADPSKPRQVGFWPCGGSGIHRFDFDGRYAYLSPEMDGYLGNIVVILDLKDPANPTEVGRWHMEGQWTAGGEVSTWKNKDHRCHHPLRMGNRLYVSYWQGGFVILDIEDMAKPKLVSRLDWSPPFPYPTHTCLPIPFEIRGRRMAVVSDEDCLPMTPGTGAFMWLVDITDETHPVPVSTFQVEGLGTEVVPMHTGCHQPAERVTGTVIPVAWLTKGVRLIDIANVHAPKEIGYFVPAIPEGEKRVQINDVCWDDRGLIFAIDRRRGLHILEREQATEV